MSSLEAKASCDSILRISDTRTSSQGKATDAANMQNHESDNANALRMQNDNTGVLKFVAGLTPPTSGERTRSSTSAPYETPRPKLT